MAIRVTLECDVCGNTLLNPYLGQGGRTQLDEVPGTVAAIAQTERWLVKSDFALCRKCQGLVEQLGYNAPA